MYSDEQTYYDLLNIKENASQDEIKSAMIEYLLSPRLDQNIDSKKIEAYKILSDPESRKKYDEFLENSRKEFTTYSYFYEPDSFILNKPEVEDQPIRPPRKPIEEPASVGNFGFLDEEPVEETKESQEKREPIRPPRKPMEGPVDVGNFGFLDEEPVEEAKESQEKKEPIRPPRKPIEEPLDDENFDFKDEEPTEEKTEEHPKIVSPFSPNEKNKKSQNTKIIKIGKKIGGVLVTFAVGAIPITTAMLDIIPMAAAGITALTLVPATVWLINRKKILVKDKKTKKISKITSAEMKEYENYQNALDEELNKLLSEQHDNYKLTLLKAKYERQKQLLKKIYEIRSNTKSEHGMLRYKLNLISIKMQIEEVNKSILKIEDQLKENDKKTKLTELNEQIEKNQQKIDKHDKNAPITLQKLNRRLDKTIKKRDRFAKFEKFKIVKQMSIYEKFLKAKAFVRSIGYLNKSEEEIDEFLMEESETTSKRRR